MERRKQSPAEHLIDLVAMLRWWAGVALAIVAYVWLHSIAVAPAPAIDGSYTDRLFSMLLHLKRI